MDELVDMVSEKVGIPREQAKQAVDVVLGFLEERLPEPLSGQLEAVLAGDMSGLGDLLGGLGGLFGK